MFGCIHKRSSWILLNADYSRFYFCAIDGSDISNRSCTVTQCPFYKDKCTCPDRIDAPFLRRYWLQLKPDLRILLTSVFLKQKGRQDVTIVKPSAGIQTLPLTPDVIKKALKTKRLDNIEHNKIELLLAQAKLYKAPKGTICFLCGEPVGESYLKIMVYDIVEGKPCYIGVAWVCADYPGCYGRKTAKELGVEYIPLIAEPPEQKVARVESIPRQLSLLDEVMG